MFQKSNPCAPVFPGPPGSGKTYMARHLSAILARDTFSDSYTREQILYKEFNCAALANFYADLNAFYYAAGMRTDISGHSWEIIDTLHDDMDKYFSEELKLFIFDDAEDVDHLMTFLNHICGVPAPAKDAPPRWKILVTRQTYKPEDQTTFSNIGAENFVHLDGLSVSETERLFRPINLDEEVIKKLRELLGTLPLPLRLCMATLKDNQVIVVSLRWRE